ncbi:MAG: zf-HC2 domain-containing protein [Caldilineaceae bacterium]|nr:zf-HC2 domain-containing protein [Caldilineaceae bacterium]MBP8109409.1 zf-HC2 domain-containing protein [Caldilineaceae bacterium]MBP8124008.1 zf-HC2 domain-containing protein [Caldilineaceae bacterium]MBP9074053.1 zf-HC2 domain-containing protein [Caldilineaceae bacterium]
MSKVKAMKSQNQAPAFTGEEHDEAVLLMSLALDGLASAEEEADLRGHVGRCARCAATWSAMQGIHQRFVAAPVAVPVAGFVARFELRRLQQARRQRLWMGGLVALLSLTLWGGILVGGVMLGGYLLNNPTGTLPQTVYDFTYYWAGLSAGVQGLWRGIVVAMSTSNLPVYLLGYTLLTLAALTAWAGFLRRSLRLVPVVGGSR